ncbi:16S rRNA (guanine(527)-N(7))-methyltransferase RsmG [Caldimonas tepidiphila]|uniref:16S rRNA (guanine(527)-N(7))-methyltransferase RsmG n=1 Tax=Caldimonas tepidiphila TaxID=2315841 RepID=UPI001F0C90D7|nr:16S rRNA (guanine(527)-N(7))-methyltransferase RsmG [Caldimonas tepidiphila]
MSAALPPEVARLEAPLREGLLQLRLALDDRQVGQLLAYLALIARWNRVYNLTAVREPADMLSQHLLDSLAGVAPLRRHTEGAPARVLDVGSGAGLPGVVFAIACPELSVTCVDTVAKKAIFIRQAAAELGLPNLRAEHARVEQLQPAAAQVVTSRAFASLHDFVALTREHLAADGVWLAFKGRVPDDELAALPPDVGVLQVEPLAVPRLDAQRCLVWLRPAG